MLDRAEVVIVATNHSEFEGPALLHEIAASASEECLLVDPWNAIGSAQVFSYVSESMALLGLAQAAGAPRSGESG